MQIMLPFRGRLCGLVCLLSVLAELGPRAEVPARGLPTAGTNWPFQHGVWLDVSEGGAVGSL